MNDTDEYTEIYMHMQLTYLLSKLQLVLLSLNDFKNRSSFT